MLRLEITSAAQADFDDAIDWYLEQEPSLPGRFLTAVEDGLAKLQQNPGGYQVVSGTNVRHVPLSKFPYVIHYRVLPDRIQILSIFHTSRDPIIWQGRIG